MSANDQSVFPSSGAGVSAPEDVLLLERLRRGDVEAGHRFVREHYPGIYRYLVHLTGRRDVAEDLTQETFLQAWRHLDAFEGRSTLRSWLYRIAHREFLQAVRRQRNQTSLEEVGEVAEEMADRTEAVELRDVIRKLPVEEGEVVILHYLEGYTAEEIAQILGAPLGRVKHRLIAARHHLQRELGEGDLVYLNEPSVPMRQWSWLPLDQMYALETRLRREGAGERQAPGPGATTEDSMERREFLRHAAVGAAGLMLPETEKDVVDSRLTQKVTCAFKGTALADLCEHLRAETGVHLAAGPSVTDEKVTLFCKFMPLREVMRQLSRPFGYTWVRSTRQGEYHYELVQDLRSQLLEEELRNRDRNEALLALEREIERYQPYRDLSPDEALARVEGASPAERPLLERLSDYRWGAIQVYFQLSPADLAALRSGQKVTFRADPKLGEHPLPSELARGVLQGYWKKRVRRLDSGFEMKEAKDLPDGLPLAAIPEARADEISLWMDEKELGHFILWGGSGIWLNGGDGSFSPVAEGRSPSVLHPQNQTSNARLAGDRSLKPVVSCQFSAPRSRLPEGARNGHKVTSADVLEALHRATGLPIVADFYTRLYATEAVSVQDQPLFDALNQLGDAMRLRWHKEGDWLQFRSVSFYDDRRKEVPNRKLSRWAAARQQRHFLALDDLIEIAQLSDAQLDAEGMSEGARILWGLAEWELPHNRNLRPHLRLLGSLSPVQRQAAISLSPGREPAGAQGPRGLGFRGLDLAQQQQFAALAFVANFGPARSLEELTEAALCVVYTQPGDYEWSPAVPGLKDEYPPLRPSPVRERTPAAALAAARRLDPGAIAAQVHPTALELTFVYTRPIEQGLRTHRACSRGNWGHDLITEPTRPRLAPGSLRLVSETVSARRSLDPASA